MSEIRPKLRYYALKYKCEKECEYCFKWFSGGYEFIQVISHNDKVLDLFGKKMTISGSSGTQGRCVRLCPECFERLHDLLEECESEGWIQLEDEEFSDEEELEEENGNGSTRKWDASLFVSLLSCKRFKSQRKRRFCSKLLAMWI